MCSKASWSPQRARPSPAISWWKNPAYGRQRISRPMRIVGPIQFWRRLALLHMFLSRNCSRWTSSSRRLTGFATHVFIKKLQQMDELVEEADWLCYTYLHQEIAADGGALREGRLAFLHMFSSRNCSRWTSSSRRPTGFATHTFIKKLQQMEELFEKADWLCYTCFHQEIAADGRARRGGWLALLQILSSRNCSRWRSSSRRPTGFATHVFIKKLQQMDKLVEEADCWGPMRGLEKNYMKRGRETNK